jgi:hypothetical protein
MGVIEIEYSELRELQKKILEGSINKETAALVIKTFSEQGKRIDQYLKVVSLTINHKKAAALLIEKNIVSDGVAIEVGDESLGKYKCPAKGDALIDAAGCLDFSGMDHNIDSCQMCDRFSKSRKLLFVRPEIG